MNVTPNTLRALQVFSSTDTTRPKLWGARVNPTGILEATDGSIALTVRLPESAGNGIPTAFTLPAGTLKDALKAAGSKDADSPRIALAPESVKAGFAEIPFLPDGTQPGDWPNVDACYPSTNPESTFYLNAGLAAEFFAALAKLAPSDRQGVSLVKVEVYGDAKPVKVTGETRDGGTFSALLMPCRAPKTVS